MKKEQSVEVKKEKEAAEDDDEAAEFEAVVNRNSKFVLMYI